MRAPRRRFLLALGVVALLLAIAAPAAQLGLAGSATAHKGPPPKFGMNITQPRNGVLPPHSLVPRSSKAASKGHPPKDLQPPAPPGHDSQTTLYDTAAQVDPATAPATPSPTVAGTPVSYPTASADEAALLNAGPNAKTQSNFTVSVAPPQAAPASYPAANAQDAALLDAGANAKTATSPIGPFTPPH